MKFEMEPRERDILVLMRHSTSFYKYRYKHIITVCSQSLIFSQDRQDRALTSTGGHLGFICTEGGTSRG